MHSKSLQRVAAGLIPLTCGFIPWSRRNRLFLSTISLSIGFMLGLVLTFGVSATAQDHVSLKQPSNRPEITADLQRAQSDLKANDQVGAAELFRAVLKLDPTNVEAQANLGVIAFFHGDCPAASEHIRAALKGGHALARPLALLAICEKRQGTPAAGADLQKAFDTLDDAKLRTQVGVELADLFYQQGDLPRTASVLQTLAGLSPDNADILFFEQRVYSELADGTLNKLALLAPNSARMEQLIAERLINAGDLKQATLHYRKAIEIDPRLPGMHYELAESLMEDSPNDAETQKQALAELAMAVTMDGDSARIEDQRGRIATLQSTPEVAQQHYERALKLSPGDPQAEIGLAELLKDQNKPEEAAGYLRTAIAADPMNAEAHYKLSQVDRQLHLDAEQKKELQLFLEIRASRDKIKSLYREMNAQQGDNADKPLDPPKP